MRYIRSLCEGETIRSVYLCKSKRSAETRNGKPYDTLVLQDKTGTLDGKVWDPNSGGIGSYDEMDYIEVLGDVISYNHAPQLNIRQIRRAVDGEYNPGDYLPVTGKDVEKMYSELLSYADRIENRYLRRLADIFFREKTDFIKEFKERSAAKSVHHSFAGGLLEHTLGVVKFCEYMIGAYPILNGDLLFAAALFHDIGKVNELSPMPTNDYTDDGQLLGHIVIGIEMIDAEIRNIDGFPAKTASELKHCILAHHGEFEFGSPKKPALPEAVALHYADTTDAKMQTLAELLSDKGEGEWQGFNRLFESNLRKSSL